MSHRELLGKVSKTVKAVNEASQLNKWEVEKLSEMVEGLFSFAKFKAGNEVVLKETVPVNEKDSWGWMPYRHLLTKGSKATIVSVDWYNNSFRYGIQFKENSWISDNGEIKFSDGEGGLFTLSEKWFEKL